MDDTSKIFICKKLSSSHTSINASLIIFIIFFVLFQGKTQGKSNLLMAYDAAFS